MGDVPEWKKSMPAFQQRAKILDFMAEKSFEEKYPYQHTQPLYLKEKPFILKWPEDAKGKVGRTSLFDDIVK